MSANTHSRLTSSSFPFIFPIYLLPTLPFRRAKHASPPAPPSTDLPPAQRYLDGNISRLRCAHCATDLCLSSQIISKGFTGRLGRAYLISPSSSSSSSSLPNTKTHPPVLRQLVTGVHTVSDVSCVFCSTVLGWKYEGAEDEGQRYKVGKFILETKEIRVDSCWEGGWGGNPCGEGMMMNVRSSGGSKDVEFDSADEDECEDLFAGVWSPRLASWRREGKRFGRRGAR